MLTAVAYISTLFIPAIITGILLYALYKKARLYDAFIEGANEGLKAAVEILPFIIGIFICIESVVASGALDALEMLIAPLFELLGIPKELISLILLRPVSGSGSLVLVESIMEESGADTFIGRSASVMVGSCETVFYVLALYFGVTHVKKLRHSVAAGIIGYVVGIIGALAICKVL